MNVRYSIVALCSLVMIAGCKADRVVVDLEQSMIEAAIAGQEDSAEFEATFEVSGELDGEKQAELKAIETIVRANMDILDFEVTGDGSTTQIEIVGNIPVTAAASSSSAWYISVEPFVDGTYIVSLKPGQGYNTLESSVENINSMYAPDLFHPTTVRLEGQGAQITVPAGYVEGNPEIMYSTTVDGRISMRFAGGIFDDVGATFLYRK